MGSVWRAEHLELKTPAAIKLMDESAGDSPEALERFRREAQAAASLRSTHVVQILDYGIDGTTPYIAMELLDGESLAERLYREGRIEPVECATILLQVAKALTKAHELHIVHRDLKPGNIFLARDGDDEVTKVLDFGIAKYKGAIPLAAGAATRTGSLMGTPCYMSPEQASGRRAVDPRADIWAFAIVAYECLTGLLPFSDTSLGGLLLSICTEAPSAPSKIARVPAGFDEWFARCTAKDPGERFQSIREAASTLAALCGVTSPSLRASGGVGVDKGQDWAESHTVSRLLTATVALQPAAVRRRRIAALVSAGLGLVILGLVTIAVRVRRGVSELAQPLPTVTAEPTHLPALVPAASTAAVAAPVPTVTTSTLPTRRRTATGRTTTSSSPQGVGPGQPRTRRDLEETLGF